MSSPSIILETEHLLMRPFVDDDKEHYTAMMSHHDVHTWLGIEHYLLTSASLL